MPDAPPFAPIPGFRPEILAPAGSRAAALAALAAGADAIYLGLKSFSARMEAENFSLRDLEELVGFAHSLGRRVHVALNTLVKPDEEAPLRSLLGALARNMRPDALIMQDLGAIRCARECGFAGEIHLSTLACVSSPQELEPARRLGASRVVLARELSIDEIRQMSAACPQGLSLEVFVHGALCFCISGRCLWSSYLGGKSGLRGRCVQPCRRAYEQGRVKGSFFSCRDLSLDVLAKTLLSVPGVASWKIEGRRKGAHYVYYTTAAYILVRDNPDDPQAKKMAQELLALALGRETTHARFLPQRPMNPTARDRSASGMFVGKVRAKNLPAARGAADRRPRLGCELSPRVALAAGDLLRIGFEDGPGHHTVALRRPVPRGGTLTLPLRSEAGAPVFLIDRREPELERTLREWEKRLAAARPEPDGRQTLPADPLPASSPPEKKENGQKKTDFPLAGRVIRLQCSLPRGGQSAGREAPGLWLSRRTLEAAPRTLFSRIVWWLPPVIWPDGEEAFRDLLEKALKRGGSCFVLNQPWQIVYFSSLAERAAKRRPALIAGPFCNTANRQALETLAGMGFCAAFASVELSGKDMLALAETSPLPLGAILSGFWPIGISRFTMDGGREKEGLTSPKKELFWTRRYGEDLWLYADRPLDLAQHRTALEEAGYAFFARVEEKLPAGLAACGRTSSFNWSLELH